MALDDSTIAQFVFDRDPALSLSILVRELDAALGRSGAGRRSVTWDCNDLVFLDLDGLRFTLSYSGDITPGLPASLMISVGPGPEHRQMAQDRRRYADLCLLIADRLRLRFAPRETLWHQVAGPVTADLVDDLFARLPDLSGGAATVPLARRSAPAEAIRAFPETEGEMPVSFVEKALAIRAAKAERARAATGAISAPAPKPANIQPDIVAQKTRNISGIRAVLYPEHEDTPPESIRMRLAASTLDVTLMMVYLPMGAAMLTISLLKGGNVTSSARVMALTCTALGFSHLLGISPDLSVL
jgi:hypothetical protein